MVLFTPGPLEWWTGLVYAVLGFHGAMRDGPAERLVILGTSGEARAEVLFTCQDLGLAGRVEIVPSQHQVPFAPDVVLDAALVDRGYEAAAIAAETAAALVTTDPRLASLGVPVVPRRDAEGVVQALNELSDPDRWERAAAAARRAAGAQS